MFAESLAQRGAGAVFIAEGFFGCGLDAGASVSAAARIPACSAATSALLSASAFDAISDAVASAEAASSTSAIGASASLGGSAFRNSRLMNSPPKTDMLPLPKCSLLSSMNFCAASFIM